MATNKTTGSKLTKTRASLSSNRGVVGKAPIGRPIAPKSLSQASKPKNNKAIPTMLTPSRPSMDGTSARSKGKKK